MTHYHQLICTQCYAERIPPNRAKLGYKNLHELRRVNRTSKEAHHCTHEQEQLHAVHRPRTAQAVKPQEDDLTLLGTTRRIK